MTEEKLIGPVEVVREEDGYWYHPGIPDFDEDAEAGRAWLEAQGLKVIGSHMDSDLESIPTGKTTRLTAWAGSLRRRPVMTGSCLAFSTQTTARMCSGHAAR